MNTENEIKKDEIIFMQFVMGLSQSGMMQLGKIMNPMTQKIEKDLNAAQATIDMLCMLRDKTKGNLSKSEEDILTNSISTLQMNYVDEAGKKEDSEQEAVSSEQSEKPEDSEQEAVSSEQSEKPEDSEQEAVSSEQPEKPERGEEEGK